MLTPAKSVRWLQKAHAFPASSADKERPSRNVEGWLTDWNRVLLYKYLCATCRGARPRVVLELGAWLGLSTTFILDHTPANTHVVSVDMWQGDDSIGHVDKWRGVDLYEQFIANTEPYAQRLHPLRKDIRESLGYLRENGVRIDLVYLDGGHTYSDVIGDLEAIHRHYPGVAVVGDDYLFYPSVRQAVCEYRIKRQIPFCDSDGNCYALLNQPPTYHTPAFLSHLPFDTPKYKPREKITSINQPQYTHKQCTQIISIFAKQKDRWPAFRAHMDALSPLSKKEIKTTAVYIGSRPLLARLDTTHMPAHIVAVWRPTWEIEQHVEWNAFFLPFELAAELLAAVRGNVADGTYRANRWAMAASIPIDYIPI